MDKKDNMKYCPSCQTWKDLTGYSSDGKGRGLRRTCKSCTYDRKKRKKKEKEEKKFKLAHALCQVSRNELERLEEITEREFVSLTNSEEDMKEFSFTDIKLYAEELLMDSGHCRPRVVELPPGRYLVGGDSHGKHTKTKMFDLLKVVNQYLGVDNFIHVGHILDDDNDMSYNWDSYFDNLIVLSKMEELHTIENIVKNKEYSFEAVRDEIKIGDWTISNQDLINDYTKTYIKNLDAEIFPESIIVNSHRLEFATRTTYNGNVFVYSPGSLCEKHIVKTIKQIDFTAGYQVKQAKATGFKKYRRMKHMYEFWQQGLLLVDYDGENVTVSPMKIVKIGNDYVTSYFNDIITSNGIVEPDKKIMLNGDYHVPFHDRKVLDIQESVCKDYEPDVFVNAGDFMDGDALNHHKMDRGQPIESCILKEFAQGHYILKRMSKWAPECYVIHGNHERFYEDFTSKYPQLSNLLNFKVLSDVEKLGYKSVDLKDVLELGSLHVIHGDMYMYGQGGSKQEKASRTFRNDVIMGHVHYPSKRFNAYTMGLTGQLDQDYNEVNASNWVHGFAMVNQYKGVNFINVCSIVDYKILMNGKLYEPEEDDYWNIGDFTASIKFDF